MTLKLISWNINGIRAAWKKGLAVFLEKEKPFVLALQETKAQSGQLDEEILKPAGYQTFWSSAERKGYSGVALYCAGKPLAVKEGLGIKKFDSEGRTLTADFAGFRLINCYFPNGNMNSERLAFKLEYCETLLKYASAAARGKAVVVCGDFNTAHREIDLARPKENQKTSGFLPIEREWIDRFITAGFTDTFRHFCSDGGHYTWWDLKTRARDRNAGWRLDYFFASSKNMDTVKAASILSEMRGSDHCPVKIEICG